MNSKNPNSIGLYKAFEDLHRGSHELIKSRLGVYLPFIEVVKSIYPPAPSSSTATEAIEALDLGCGRGEWLELLKENGVSAEGIDLDDDMLSACRARGLKVATGDAVAYLQSRPNNSRSVISGFHIAEHLSLDDLKILVEESLRVLKPAGLLILEAPNTENLVVGTSSFYLDPTHQRPLPSQLLTFLTDYFGFARSKLLRLQEPALLRDELTPVSLFNVLSAVSPDYAVIAQKQAETNILARFDTLFNQDYGLSLAILASRYQAHLNDVERQVQFLTERIDKIWRLFAPLRWVKNLFSKDSK
ncbi:bifunctional 2-polyprenyl-6-hydroxyphenol methylase/3-demethylubiquinol 3-O-methyltransferase UbiG [Polynucleobacter sp. IMCC 30228]|uniref:class I SAM-dependent methyltransferase n=1 Tax=Polynucleobacter sp. IMCC 30228 TaxID=2781011 RepID=UPI001F45F305|nr:class I SAM-dependent methyltransferase [Polynucleobacter sp. IMCC 30228]MCE7527923.1 methyltransferase domain-containing protein [Polynucleobacter sp. IMCC 30228]